MSIPLPPLPTIALPSAPKKPLLAYYNIRGLGNPIRMLLEYVGQEYDFRDWYKAPIPGWRGGEKFKQDLTFPNLPYYVDDRVRLTQSNAIIRHVARKYKMVAETEEEILEQDVLDGIVADLRAQWYYILYLSSNFEHDKAKFRCETIEPMFMQLDGFLAGRQYMLGKRLTYIDFVLLEIFDVQQMLFADIFRVLPNLKRYHRQLKNLKGVKEYLESDRNPKQINGNSAHWGGKPGFRTSQTPAPQTTPKHT